MVLETESCLYCKFKDELSNGSKRFFSCWRYPSHERINDYPQNYTCGEFIKTDKEVVKKAKVDEIKVNVVDSNDINKVVDSGKANSSDMNKALDAVDSGKAKVDKSGVMTGRLNKKVDAADVCDMMMKK